ncbi:MAG TPA: hypothetical protein VD999_07400 [Vitreimonas sp.]|nr:hypothetical protein [Vitreimonas sp.]
METSAEIPYHLSEAARTQRHHDAKTIMAIFATIVSGFAYPPLTVIYGGMATWQLRLALRARSASDSSAEKLVS